jgi:hypothetical protein
MISAKKTDEGDLILEYDKKVFACPVIVRGQIVCICGDSEDKAIENTALFLAHEEKIKNQAKDLATQAYICFQANLTDRGEQLLARAKKLDPEADFDN